MLAAEDPVNYKSKTNDVNDFLILKIFYNKFNEE
jgi:hypothetical protein